MSCARFFRFTGVRGISVFGFALAALLSFAVANDAADWSSAKAAYEGGHWPEAESKLVQIWNQVPRSGLAEDAGVVLIDVYLREEKLDWAGLVIQRFRQEFPASPQFARVVYDQGLLELKKGNRSEAAKFFADAVARAPTQDVFDRASQALRRVSDTTNAPANEPENTRTVLLMAPFSGEFAEVGRSLREGVTLAFEESKTHGNTPPFLKTLDDQGNLVQGVHQLRKILKESRIDALLGPAMSDVAAGVAIELSASKNPVPLITPTATTYGITSLGEGVFQLNVTTHVLGQRIAEYATGCLGLKEFVIVAPHSEYGFQLAEAFTETVQKKGGIIVAATYLDPDAADLSEQLQDLRQKVAQYFFDKMKSTGQVLDGRKVHSYLSDSTFSVDGIFVPGASGDEADKFASQIVFNKIRGQMLGSSGWYDKSVLLKNSTATQNAYFSVDYQDHPKTEAYSSFSMSYNNRWKHAPDRVAALSYDAARFLLEGMEKSSQPGTLIPALHQIQNFPGVLGNIAFGSEGVNQNTSLFHLERKSFREVQDCVAK